MILSDYKYNLLKEQEELSQSDEKALQDMLNSIMVAVKSGALDINDVKDMIQASFGDNIEETTTSSSAGAYLTKKAFKKDDLDEENITAKQFIARGGKRLPQEEATVKDFTNPSQYTTVKVGDTVYYGGFEPNEEFTVTSIYKETVGGKTFIEAENDERVVTNGQYLFKARPILSEGYNQFKKKTLIRDKSQQYHEAVSHIKNEVMRVNKMFEYLTKLKTDLTNDGDLKEATHTIKALSSIQETIKSMYTKLKRLQ